jgi:hypothetical protein
MIKRSIAAYGPFSKEELVGEALRGTLPRCTGRRRRAEH